MAGWIDYKTGSIQFNNRQFSSTMRFVTEVAEKMAEENEMPYVQDFKEEMVENYYPGKCIDIETDFPKLEERKFWAKIFYETAREIFERKIGAHEYHFWQTQRIYQIYGTADLFEKSIREIEPSWQPDIRDYQEFNEWVDKKK